VPVRSARMTRAALIIVVLALAGCSSGAPAAAPSTVSVASAVAAVPLTRGELCNEAAGLAGSFGANPDPVAWEKLAAEAHKSGEGALEASATKVATAIRTLTFDDATAVFSKDLPAECPA
jgi:predicted outer membrane protein